MAISAKEYIGRPRNSVWERDLAKELRRHPEDEKLEFIKDFATFNPVVAMNLARKCLAKKRSFETLLEQALDQADPSSIRYWLECLVPRLGFRRVITHLRSNSGTHGEGVAKAKYWLPMFAKADGYSREAVEAL
jgi:hypothetical protein